jgi:hypothetical protein
MILERDHDFCLEIILISRFDATFVVDSYTSKLQTGVS